jgi:hypothetical protein
MGYAEEQINGDHAKRIDSDVSDKCLSAIVV